MSMQETEVANVVPIPKAIKDQFRIHRMIIRHPGYNGNNILLTLAECEHDGGGFAFGQAHYLTVHAACALVANNRDDGYLTYDQAGRYRIPIDEKGLIQADQYYFHVPSEPGSPPYPVVPNFRSWEFPHADGGIPWPWWEAEQNSCGEIDPDTTLNESCRVTNSRLATETAYLIPLSERNWFVENEMERYCILGPRT